MSNSARRRTTSAKKGFQFLAKAEMVAEKHCRRVADIHEQTIASLHLGQRL